MLTVDHVEMLAAALNTTALIPNPDPAPPPGLAVFAETIISWLKWTAFVGGLAGMLICSSMITFGRRNRNQMATEGVLGAVWVLGGLALAGASSLLVDAFT